MSASLAFLRYALPYLFLFAWFPMEGGWLLAGFGVFALWRGWEASPQVSKPHRKGRVAGSMGAVVAFLVGLGADSLLLAALGWVVWLGASNGKGRGSWVYLGLALYALPWVHYDLAAVNVYVRLAYASCLEYSAAMLSIPVVRDGVFVWLDATPIAIDPPCAGLGTWQLLSLAGSLLLLGSVPRRWLWLLPLGLGGLAFAVGLARIAASSYLSFALRWETMNPHLHEAIGLGFLFLAMAGLFHLQTWLKGGFSNCQERPG